MIDLISFCFGQVRINRFILRRLQLEKGFSDYSWKGRGRWGRGIWRELSAHNGAIWRVFYPTGVLSKKWWKIICVVHFGGPKEIWYIFWIFAVSPLTLNPFFPQARVLFTIVIVYYLTKFWGNGVEKPDIIPSYKNSSKRTFLADPKTNHRNGE